MIRFHPLDRKLFRDLWRTKGQLTAIILVMASGISTFVGMLSTLDSLGGAMDDYYEHYRFGDVFVNMERAPERTLAKIARLPEVAVAESRVVADVTLDVPGTKESVTGRLISIPDSGEPRVNNVFLRLGRWPERDHPEEVIVSEAFAEAHEMMPGATLSAILNGRKQDLRVVGLGLSPEYIWSIKPGSAFPDDRLFGVLWMRREALGLAFDMEGAFNDVSLELARDANVDRVIDGVDDLLEPFGGLGAYSRKDQLSNWYIQSELQQLRTTGTAMPLIFLGVAAFLLNVVLTRMVSQQRDQIAVLKAFGYTNVQVGGHFIKLVLVVVVIAGILGVAGGAWIGSSMTTLYKGFYRFPQLDYQVGLDYGLGAVAIGLIAAILGTQRAIREAAKLPPAEAMRPLAPANYRPTLVERLGLQRFMNMSARMVSRNLERRPWKALFSVFGMGCGGALIVVGHYFMDSMDFIVDTQFVLAQRDDVSVQFNQPRSMRAIYELHEYPAVLRVEPKRSVPVRLEAGHVSRRATITGLTSTSTLQKLVDDSLELVSLPPDGLVLTDKIARILGVKRGDVVRVHVLEGRRPIEEIPVARVVSSFIGLDVYMDLEALNRRLGEAVNVTSVALLTDATEMDALYATFKETPAVAGLGLRKEAMESFEDTAAESMNIMSFFLTLFASVIACGVIYNNARVMLAEHGRELASLRVLGFRRGEISAIFLGELWLLTAVAIPVGLTLGYGISFLLSLVLDTELYRIPLHIEPASYGISAVTVAAASLISGLMVRRRLDHLDLVEVLKARE